MKSIWITPTNFRIICMHAHTKNNWLSPPVQNLVIVTHTTAKRISSLHWNQFNFDHHTKNQVDFISHTKDRKFRPAHENTVNFDPSTKKRSISVLTLKPSQFLPPKHKKVHIDASTGVKSISIPTLRTSQLCMPPIRNQVHFVPVSKWNHFRPA